MVESLENICKNQNKPKTHKKSGVQELEKSVKYIQFFKYRVELFTFV